VIPDTIWGMAETPPGGPSYGQSASGFPGAPGQFSGAPGGPPSWPSSAPRGASRLLTFVSLGISVIATVLAVVGWFRPVHTAAPATPSPAEPTYTEQQIADAKTKTCAAFEVVNKGISLQTNGADSDNPALVQAEAANARLSTISGGWYLKARLEKGTPSDLSAAIQHLSDVLLDLGANYLAGAKDSDPSQAAMKSEGNAAFAQVGQLCK
jgi:hypothetical protein